LLSQVTADNGTATPDVNANYNFYGLSGAYTDASASTLNIYSPKYLDTAVPITAKVNHGYFVTASITITLPAAPGNGDVVEIVATSGIVTIQMQPTQRAQVGYVLGSVGNTLVGTATGDSMTLRYHLASNIWRATEWVGNWNIN